MVNIKSNYRGEHPEDYTCQRSFITLLSSLAPFSQQNSFCVCPAQLPSTVRFPPQPASGTARTMEITGKASSQAASMECVQQERGPGAFWTSLCDQHAQVTACPLSLLGHSSNDRAPAVSIRVLEPLGVLDGTAHGTASGLVKQGKEVGARGSMGLLLNTLGHFNS